MIRIAKAPWWLKLGLVAAIATGVPVAMTLRSLGAMDATSAAHATDTPRASGAGQQRAGAASSPLPDGVRELAWSELMPPGWDPRHPSASAAATRLDAQALASLADDDPTARQMMAELQDAFANAPVRPELDGQRVRLRGYVVPLGVGWGGTDEFLLVPYYGACIHSPPPPPNQIVHVKAPAKIAGVRSMSVVTVTGRIQAQATSSVLATSGYRLTPEDVRLDR